MFLAAGQAGDEFCSSHGATLWYEQRGHAEYPSDAVTDPPLEVATMQGHEERLHRGVGQRLWELRREVQGTFERAHSRPVAGVENQTSDTTQPGGENLETRHQHPIATKRAATQEPGVHNRLAAAESLRFNAMMFEMVGGMIGCAARRTASALARTKAFP